jgi:hypothetical protein
MRARLCWDDDRRLEAVELGEKLARKPVAIRTLLGRTRHGALWLIERWKALGAILDREPSWNDAQKAMAFDLLGVPATIREGDPWTAAGLTSARALVEREVASLQGSLTRTLITLDEFERGEAVAGRPVRASSASRALRFEEAACWRRLLALQKMEDKETDRLIAEATALAAETPPPPPAPAPSPPPPSRLRPDAPKPIRAVATTHLSPAPAPAPTGNRRARRAALRLQRQSSR